ncbi:MAG: hypothetical protein ACAH88_05245, partial [Roseimicrobium sp.]
MRCTGLVMGIALHGCIICVAGAQKAENTPAATEATAPTASGETPANAAAAAAKAIEAMLADPKQSSRITNAEADKVVGEMPDACPGVKKYDLLNEAYKVLRPQVKQQAEHAVKARLLAAVARLGRQRITDIAEAEQLDLLLNPDQPDAWLRRGISYVKVKEEKWAADMFLEGLRRTDFARPPEFFSTLAPPTAGWIARIAKAKRTDELNAALADAFARTKPGTAGPMALAMLQAVLDVDDTPQQPQRLALLLKSVREHQQHLMHTHMVQFHQRVVAWNQSGHEVAATTLARALLLTPANGGDQALPSSERIFWGRLRERGDTEGIIPFLVYSAVREPNADFLAEAEVAARQHPRDAHLLSCVLLARATVAPLSPEVLQLAKDLDAASRLEVAWRLAELAPAEHVEAQMLAPWCAEGIAALLRKPDVAGGAGTRVRLAMQIIPWLEKNGQTAPLPALVPVLRERLARERDIGDGLVNRDLWPSLIVLAVRHGSEQERDSCVDAWRKLRTPTAGTIEDGWNECRHTVRVMVGGMASVAPEQGKHLARYAFESWCGLWSRSMKEGDSDGAVAMLVADALMSADLLDELATLEQQVRKEITFGRGVLFQSILERLHWYQKVRSPDGQVIPHANVKVVEPRTEKEEARVAWSLALQTEILERRRLQMMLGDDWLVHHNGYEAPLLHALSGRYDVEVYAGETSETLRKVAGAQGIQVQGELAIKDLPPAGWLRFVMREPRSGAVAFGEPQAYCIRQAELDSSRKPQAPPPVWGVNQEDKFGTPITESILIEPGTEYLLRVDLTDDNAEHFPRETSFPPGMSLVALDANKQPIAQLNDMTRQSITKNVGRAMALIKPDRWGNKDGYLVGTDEPDKWEGTVKASYLLLTSRQPGMGRWPVRLQKFRVQKSGPASEKLAELKSDFLALVDLEARTWFVSNIRPRAAVGGPGGIKVYDTSVTPWRMLKHLDS